MRVKDYTLNIVGLSQKSHLFEYSFGDDFFTLYGNSLLDNGQFSAEITLDKGETMIETRFQIQGEAHLICDRSLEPFNLPMKIDRTIRFKYGQEEKELSEEIVLISRERTTLDLGHYMYELITVDLPMKRLHPKYKDEDPYSEIQLVYSTSVAESEKEKDTIDPRWEVLKKLK